MHCIPREIGRLTVLENLLLRAKHQSGGRLAVALAGRRRYRAEERGLRAQAATLRAGEGADRRLFVSPRRPRRARVPNTGRRRTIDLSARARARGDAARPRVRVRAAGPRR
jgi:hypothetical protein